MFEGADHLHGKEGYQFRFKDEDMRLVRQSNTGQEVTSVYFASGPPPKRSYLPPPPVKAKILY
ncbi:hypothetical protein FRX31_008571 [Thalictrum thalictroides]|uniref:Uncharacterized protein n=1 Tax=Thalictrum thalictroides TaxID=46969 RepID=A0A7J6WXQ6_THATH|nr:hypothetical protein FRX31_008571 [Thalictrum thalictroides]